MTDRFGQHAGGLSSPLTTGFSITPDDNTDLAITTRQLYAAGAGNVSVVWVDGSASVEPIAAGERVDWRIARVKATGTTATGIRGYA